MLILNLCDINDDAENIYHKELLKYYSKGEIRSYKYDPTEHPGEFLLKLMCAKYDLIVGHGFGGLLALIIGRATGIKTILINPMYPANRYWQEFYPDYEYKSFIWSISDSEICWDTHGESTENVYLILGKDDDLIDTETTDKYLTSGNSFYVEGGHWPSGDDFILKFGELSGGLIPASNGVYEKADTKENRLFTDFCEILQLMKAKYNLLYFYVFKEEDAGNLTKISKRYLSSLKESENIKCRYITADMLPLAGNGIRVPFKDLDFLIIDKVVKIILSDEIRRSLWIACDEVTSHGGKVVILSDEHAADLFEEDKDIMDLIYTGIIKELYFDNYSSNRSIRFNGYSSDDTGPYEDHYRTVIIDDLKTKHGNLAIKWHSPDLEDQMLYLYFKDDQWFYDSGDGWSRDTLAKAVLRAAVDKFVDGAKDTEHDAHHFFGWGW